MAIHHSQRAQGERMGFTIEERGKLVAAFHASTAVQIFGVSGKDVITQMTAYLNIHSKDHEVRFTFDRNDERNGHLRRLDDGKVTHQEGTPVELFRMWGNKELEWITPQEFEARRQPVDEPTPEQLAGVAIEDTFEPDADPKPEVDPTPPIARNTAGVPLDGATAYAEGIMAADNPYEEGTEEADQWDTQWDQAADESDTGEDGDAKGGSVVASKYRTKYAEQGHPTHCGDWLAELLNNYCIGDKNTDLETFEVICGLNDVDTSKYRRSGVGWQGRIRMTGRNLLAKKVFARGYIFVPDRENGDAPLKTEAPADWLSAQRYTKPKAA